MKIRFIIVPCLLIISCFFQSNALAQKLEPFGLQGKAVTALAHYNGALYAGTDGDGVYVRQLNDSTWVDSGLSGVHIRSVYPHDIGPIGWGITVGTDPDESVRDSVMTYCWSSYDPTWVPSDSGFDRQRVSYILSIDGFPDPRI